MPQTLLQKAKAVKTTPKFNHSFTKEEEELVIAWFNDEIRLTQLASALNQKNSASCYNFIALVAKQIFRNSQEK